MALPPDVRSNYIQIIDSILETADLHTISVKSIREGIADKVEYDIQPHKSAIKELISERFDIYHAKKEEQDLVQSVEKAEEAPTTNGHSHSRSASESQFSAKREAESDDLSDVVDSPPKKKRKASTEDDAQLAARLQAEEQRQARPTRGGSSRKSAPAKKKKTPKKKTAAKVTGSDDSDVENGDGTERKVNRNTGFHKPMILSPVAADFFGEAQLSRPQVTKRVWEYIKSQDLQDPGDKRYIICDDKLRTLLKQDKVHMFTMTKLLNKEMKNPEE